ncbi:hypothetical protein VTJ04DRAFT_8768 [Mycothermus thermophilus]|uniref:uncharacterized protein n=1 Tax=Humicola insolens TaxID=85995 RepID=UPI00374211D5
MGRNRRREPSSPSGSHAKHRHRMGPKGMMDWNTPVPEHIAAMARLDRPELDPKKYKVLLELVESPAEKKKLKLEFTSDITPPAGYHFVPIRNPYLSSKCKELSREQQATVFVVMGRPEAQSSGNKASEAFSREVDRIGYHFLEAVVDQAKASLPADQLNNLTADPLVPEPIPETQEEIFKQANAAILDAFPRIPNPDREMILIHAFDKSRHERGQKRVGLCAYLPLAKRVQLAVVAHIRHNHTGYDKVLKYAHRPMARKAVEDICLDILRKWRGDEENGRDDAENMFREIIMISDSDSEDSSDSEDESSIAGSSLVSSANPSTVGRPAEEEGPERTPSATGSAPVAAVPASRPADNARAPEHPHASFSPQRVTKTGTKQKRTGDTAARISRYMEASQAASARFWQQVAEQESVHGDVANRGYPVPVGTDSRGHESRVYEQQRQQQHAAHNPYRGLHTAAVHQAPAALTHDDYHRAHYSPVRAPEAERVRHQGQDLKDYLVPSIEPASEQSGFSGFIAPARRSDPDLLHSNNRTLGSKTQAQSPTMASTGPAAQPFHAAFAGQGFIKLPPRSEPDRAPRPPQLAEPFILLNPEPGTTREQGSPTSPSSSGPGMQYHTARSDGASARAHESRASPVFIDLSGRVLREQSSSIRREASPRARREEYQLISMSDARVPAPEHQADLRQPDTAWVQSRNERNDFGVDNRANAPRNSVPFFTVSNTFPRQYEPRPGPATTSYDVRPSAAPQQPYTHEALSLRPARDSGLSQAGPAPHDRAGASFSNSGADYTAQPPAMYVVREGRPAGAAHPRPGYNSVDPHFNAAYAPAYDSRSQPQHAPPPPGVPLPSPQPQPPMQGGYFVSRRD